MIQKIIILIVGILLIPSISINAQTKSLSLNDAIQLGKENNANVKLSELEKLKAKFITRESIGNLYPSINNSLGYNRNVKPPVFFFPSFDLDQTSGGLTVNDRNLVPITAASANAFDFQTNFSMPIFNQTVNKRITISKLNEKLQGELVTLTKEQVNEEIQKAYYNVLLSESSKNVAKKSIENASSNLAFIRSRYQQGFVSANDTLSVYINAESMKAGLIHTENRIKQTKNLLKFLIGLPLETEIELTDELEFDKNISFPNEVDYSKRPEMRISMLNSEISNQQIKLEKSQNLPDLQLVSQFQIIAQSDNFKFSRYEYPQAFFIGVQLNIPIFNGFRVFNKVNIAKADFKKAEIQQANLKAQISLEIQNAFDNLTEAEKNFRLQTDLLNAAERNLFLITDRWKNGLIRFIEVSDAELEYIKVQMNLISAIHQYNVAKVEYKKSIGNNN